jgi:general secretion pathway protein D
VLGWLFRNDTSKKIKTNLLLFLTPYIIRDQSDYRRIFERKMAERAEFVKRFTGIDSKYVTPIDYSRKASPMARLSRTVDLEMNKVENGGPGISGERLIQPAPRFPAADPGASRPPYPLVAPAPSTPAPAAPAPARTESAPPIPATAPVKEEPGAVISHPELDRAPPASNLPEPGSVPPDHDPDMAAPQPAAIIPAK